MLNYSILSSKDTKKIGDDTYIDLLYKSFIIPSDFTYKVIKITKDYMYRPDLISIAVYGNSSYADVLCKINGVCDIREMGLDKRLVIPDFKYISYFYNIESNSGIINTDGDGSENTTQKTQTEVRKANEQVVGDSNFRINKDSKIIIY